MVRIEITGGSAMVELGTAIGLTPALLATRLGTQLNARGLRCTVDHVAGPVVEVRFKGVVRLFERFLAWRLRRNLGANGMDVGVTVVPET